MAWQANPGLKTARPSREILKYLSLRTKINHYKLPITNEGVLMHRLRLSSENALLSKCHADILNDCQRTADRHFSPA